jgi:hypothetical protein
MSFDTIDRHFKRKEDAVAEHELGVFFTAEAEIMRRYITDNALPVSIRLSENTCSRVYTWIPCPMIAKKGNFWYDFWRGYYDFNTHK